MIFLKLNANNTTLLNHNTQHEKYYKFERKKLKKEWPIKEINIFLFIY